MNLRIPVLQAYDSRWPRKLLAAALAVLVLAATVLVTAPPANAVANAPASWVRSAQTWYTYVQAGESMSSRFTKAQSWDDSSYDQSIHIVRPDGSSPADCIITFQQPNNTVCAFAETATTTGVYAVSIQRAPGEPATSQGANRLAWNITTAAPGRTWSESFRMFDLIQTPVPLMSLWYQTEHGYTYQIDRNGINGIDSVFAANAFGNVDTETCASAYRSIAASPANLETRYQTLDSSGCEYSPYKVFFERPDIELPSVATLPDGTETWLNVPITTPVLSGPTFAASAPGSRSGTVSYTVSDFEGSVSLQVDTDNDGVFDGANDRTVTVPARGGAQHTWAFDGLDGSGAAIPVSTPLAFRVHVDRVGEIHFTDGDLEVRSGGIKATRLNGSESPSVLLHWDDSYLTPAADIQAANKCSTVSALTSAPAGTDSSSGVHSWGLGNCATAGPQTAANYFNVGNPNTNNYGGTWGNNRNIDDWTYAAADLVSSSDVPGYTVSKSSIPTAGNTVAAGTTIDYSVTTSAVRYGHPEVITPALEATTWAGTVTDDLTAVIDDATVPLTDLQTTPDAGSTTVAATDGASWTWIGTEVPLTSPSVVTTYSATVLPAGSGDGILRNVAFIGTDPPTECLPGLCGTTDHYVPGFTVTKTALPASGSAVRPGDTITYTVTGTNTGATDLDPVTLTDDLSGVTPFATLTGTPTASMGSAPIKTGNTLVWTGALGQGEAVTISYTVTVDATAVSGTTIRNSVTGSAVPPDLPPITTPPIVTEHPTGGFTLTKSSDPVSGTAITPGDSVTYTVSGTNTGSTTLDPVVITDDLSAVLNHATLVGSPESSVGAAPELTGSTLEWTGVLPVGATVVLTYTVILNEDAPAGTVLKNVVTGTATPPGLPPITPPPVTTQHPTAGFALAKSSDPANGAAVSAGDTITYTLTGTNTGATALDPVTIRDDLSRVLSNAQLVGSPTSSSGLAPTITGTTLTWSGALALNGVVTISYTVKINADVPDSTIITNTVSGSATPPGLPPINPPEVVTQNPVPGFALAKTSEPPTGSTVRGGDTIVYTVTGANTGATILDPVTISDDLSGILGNAQLTGDPTASIGGVETAAPTITGTELAWSGPLQIGETVTIVYTVTVAPEIESGVFLINRVVAEATPPGLPPVIPPPVVTEHSTPGFTLTKTSDPASGSTVSVGGTITYTVTGTNTGEGTLKPVVITDDLSKVLNNTALIGTPHASIGAAPEINGTTLSWTGELATGASVVLSYTVKVNVEVGAQTVISNTVGGTATPPTGPPITPPEVTTTHPVPGFTIAKTSDPRSGSEVRPGQLITYTVTGANTGATTLSPVTITDDLSKVLSNAKLEGAPAASIGGAPSLSSSQLEWTGALEPGQTVVITYTVRVNNDVAGVVLHNTVVGQASPPGLPPITPPKSETTHTVPIAGLALTGSAAGIALTISALLVLFGGALLVMRRRRSRADNSAAG